jgi:hypothetical protein
VTMGLPEWLPPGTKAVTSRDLTDVAQAWLLFVMGPEVMEFAIRSVT